MTAAKSEAIRSTDPPPSPIPNPGTGTDLQKEDAAAINSYCAKYNCEFMLTLGDNFYDGPNSTSDPRFSSQFTEM